MSFVLWISTSVLFHLFKRQCPEGLRSSPDQWIGRSCAVSCCQQFGPGLWKLAPRTRESVFRGLESIYRTRGSISPVRERISCPLEESSVLRGEDVLLREETALRWNRFHRRGRKQHSEKWKQHSRLRKKHSPLWNQHSCLWKQPSVGVDLHAAKSPLSVADTIHPGDLRQASLCGPGFTS